MTNKATKIGFIILYIIVSFFATAAGFAVFGYSEPLILHNDFVQAALAVAAQIPALPIYIRACRALKSKRVSSGFLAMISSVSVIAYSVFGLIFNSGAVSEGEPFNFPLMFGSAALAPAFCAIGESIQARIFPQSNDCFEHASDKILRPLVILILAAALLAFTFSAIIYRNAPELSLINGIAVLAAACPCALGIAVPLAAAGCATEAQTRRIMFRSIGAVENARKIQAVAFDKTGTLTIGKPSVREFRNLSTLTDKYLMRLVKAALQEDTHPVAKIIYDYCAAATVADKNLTATEFCALDGSGASAVIDGKQIVIGDCLIFFDAPVKVKKGEKNPFATGRLKKGAVLPHDGVVIAIDGEVAAHIIIGDSLKACAGRAVAELEKIGVDTFLLTADGMQEARLVASEAGIRNIFANLSPEDKAEFITGTGMNVVYVGNGEDDVSALSAAHIAIATSDGAPQALEASDIIIDGNKLDEIPMLMSLSRRVFRVMLVNLGLAIGAGIVFAVGGMLGALALPVKLLSTVASVIAVWLNSALSFRKQ